MTRMLFAAALALSALFAAAVALIHTQPFDDSGLRLLPTADCAAPCFLGIRPGVTTESEALAILQAHAWIGGISQRQTDYGYNIWYNLYWSGRQPRFIDSAAPGVLYVQWINSDTVPLVFTIEVQTTATLGDLYLAMRQPESVNVSPMYDAVGFSGLLIENAYESAGVVGRTYVNCPLTPRRLIEPHPLTLAFGTVYYYPDRYPRWASLYSYPGC